MNKTGTMIIVLIVASIAGAFGKSLVNEMFFQNSKNSAIKECVGKYGQSEEDCRKMVESAEQDLRISRVQTGEQREDSIREANRKAFMSGCTAQNQTESYCQCGWEKIIDKYTYEGFNDLKSKVDDVGLEGLDSDPKLKSFVGFMTEEIPKLCRK